jgi:hypothetical protein
MFAASAVLVVVGVVFVIRRPKPKGKNRYTILGFLVVLVWGLFFGHFLKRFLPLGQRLGSY